MFLPNSQGQKCREKAVYLQQINPSDLYLACQNLSGKKSLLISVGHKYTNPRVYFLQVHDES